MSTGDSGDPLSHLLTPPSFLHDSEPFGLLPTSPGGLWSPPLVSPCSSALAWVRMACSGSGGAPLSLRPALLPAGGGGVGEGLGPLVLVGQHSTSQRQQGLPSLLTLACAFLPRPGRTRGGGVLSGTLQGAGRVRPSTGAPSFPARVPEPVPSARTGDVSMERALSVP